MTRGSFPPEPTPRRPGRSPAADASAIVPTDPPTNGPADALSQRIAQSLTPKPLAIILSSSGEDAVEPGDTFELGVTVSNRSSQSVTVHIFIDSLPPLLRPWCATSQEYLALAPQQSGEVVFRLRIPVDALPGTFNYLVVVDALYQDYPPSQYPQQLQILPSSLNTVRDSDPTFVIQPATTAASPQVLQPGATLPVQIIVYNRSERVDRFRLHCMDLPDDWFTIEYPKNEESLGLVLKADSLRLNPGDQRQIFLLIHPPVEALAGRYAPTLQISSENNPSLGLLDLVYLRILPLYLLQPVLRTLVGQISSQPGKFELWLENAGNTERHILVEADDSEEGHFCTYTLAPNPATIPPKTTGRVQIQVKPTKWWKRPLWGGGKVINLRVALLDEQQHPLQNNLLQGALVWSARPWWQLLPLVLLALGVVGLLVGLIWWLLRPPVVPNILDFFVEDARYAAADGDIARVGWQVEHPNRIRSLKIVGRSPDGQVISGPVVYDFGETLPTALKPFCTQDAELLVCRNVRTDARQPGEYVFELILLPAGRRRNPPQSSQSDPVVIEPVPSPQITDFAPMQPTYQEVLEGEPTAETGETAEGTGEIALQWAVSQPENLQALILTGYDEDGTALGEARYDFLDPGTAVDAPGGDRIPASLRPYCTVDARLECTAVPTGIRQPGRYTFELTAIPRQDGQAPPEPVASDPVEIQPFPAQITTFLVNGEEAQPKYLIPVDQGQPPPMVQLDWDILGGPSTTAALTPSPGTVPLQGAIALPLGQPPGSTTFTLQVTQPGGQSLTRSVTFETFDPTPPDPADAAAAAAAAAAEAIAGATASETPGAGDAAPALGTPTPSVPGTLSPTETPPRLD